MAEVVVFHHAQGRTDGVLAFAETLREAGHVVHAPDLYDGRTFDDIDAGVDNARSIGFDAVVARGVAAVDALPEALVYVGFSLGVMPAQTLAQSRPGARGAVLFAGAMPPEELGGAWPDGLPAQIHLSQDDSWITPPNPDWDAAHELAATVPEVELFLYPGDRHLFADASLPAYDEASAALFRQRTLDFLAGLG